MTGRVRWIGLFGFIALVFGLVRYQHGLALLAMAILLWILVEWLRFVWRLRWELDRLTATRTLNGRESESGVLWADRIVDVEVRVQAEGAWMRSKMIIRDVIPEILQVLDDRSAKDELDSSMLQRVRHRYQQWVEYFLVPEKMDVEEGTAVIHDRKREVAFSYRVQVRAAGRCDFVGLRVTMTDPNGFFRVERLLPLKQSFKVLPGYVESGDLQPSIKRINALPQHGIHRLQRSGMGSELLELREYVAGDPPKSIAWKVSARRDKLMTRQYESEVPIRLQLFLDGSPSVRLGGYGKRLIDQLSLVAASLARSATSIGDPVGLHLIDDQVERMPCSSGERGFHRVLQMLADFSTTKAPEIATLNPVMFNMAFQQCQDRYPEWMDDRYNQPPYWMLPLPFASRRQLRKRFRLAGVMAERYQLSEFEYTSLIHDDAYLARFIARFLCDCGVPWMEPIVDRKSLEDTVSSYRLDLLANAITHAVAHAKDNEVFVVMADLLEMTPQLPLLVRSLKLALSRHHRVAFVCPTTTFERPKRERDWSDVVQVEDWLLEAERARVRDRATRLKRELGKLGIPISFSGESSAIQMVLNEVDSARTGRARIQGVLK